MRPRILIVEDDAILALRIRKLVESMGYEAAGLAATGEDAIRLAETVRPDVALMDVRLRGEMSGIEAAARIHSRVETPVIYLTAFSDELLIEQATKTEPYAYLTKPVRDRELHASIEMALYKSRTDRTLSHLHRVLRSVRDVNQLITRERDPQALLEQACQILVRTSGYAAVWIVRADPDGTVTTRAQAGTTVELVPVGEETGAADPAGLDPTAGWREQRSVVVAARAGGSAQKDRAPGSAALVPMLFAGETYGGLCVYASPRGSFDDEEMSLLLELAGDLAFALHGLEEAERRHRAELALRASEERFIADLKRAEAALAASNENWRRLVEYQPIGNVVHRDGRILYANQACLQMAGAAGPEDLIGREVLAFVHPDSRALAAERLASLPERGAAGEMTSLMLVRVGGEPIDVEMTSLPITYLGEPAIQTVFFDVTERRRAEEQLRRAQKLDSVGRLAAGVAHDFNNMLQSIFGHGQLLLSRLHAADARRKHAEQILEAAVRCRDLNRQLLAFSRNQVLDLRVVDLRGIVGQLETLLRGSLREDVSVAITLSEDACRVKGDVGQLEQVLMNLAVNAQDAMPTGGELRIAVAPWNPEAHDRPLPAELAPQPFVELIVADTGCGMDAHVREHAFEPFFTACKPSKGTGLGLAMVHGIVKQHGGGIRLDSAPGAGTTFWIYLPRVADTAPVPAEHAAEAELARGSETVLLVEDDVRVRQLAQELLVDAGYEVLTAAHGEDALAVARAHEGRVDLLLADIVMPRVGGTELANRLRQARPDVKVLLMSGHADEAIAAHLTTIPRDMVLEKPFTAEVLTRRVREALAQRGKTILVVDDEKEARELAREILESLGHRVIEAASGREALAQYTTRRFEIDLIVLDEHMPDLEGAETLLALQALGAGAAVLLACAELRPEAAGALVAAGAAGFVQKPYRLEEMSRAIASPRPGR
jgi:PAS domain S-box-containing protein